MPSRGALEGGPRGKVPHQAGEPSACQSPQLLRRQDALLLAIVCQS